MPSIIRTCVHTFLIGILVLFCSVYFLGCDTFLKTSYESVYAATTTYEVSKSILGDLYRKGEINEEQKTQIVEVATKYYYAIMLAKKALIAHKKVENSGNQESIDKAQVVIIEALIFMQAAEVDLLNLIG